MSTGRLAEPHEEQEVWRAPANPVRRHLLDLLGSGPRTTGDLADAVPGLSRYAVMQHLGVLTDAGLVRVRRRGRHRYNHLDPVRLQRWFRRWVGPMAGTAADEMLALERHLEEGSRPMPAAEFRTVRIETELRFAATPERVFAALTAEKLEWFPRTYGEDRVQGIVVEPRVGGAHYEDWGDGAGYLYGRVTVWDPPHRFATRGRVMAGTILDGDYSIEAAGDTTILRMSKVAAGPMTEEEAAGIAAYGDIARFEDGLRRVVES